MKGGVQLRLSCVTIKTYKGSRVISAPPVRWHEMLACVRDLRCYSTGDFFIARKSLGNEFGKMNALPKSVHVNLIAGGLQTLEISIERVIKRDA